MSATITEAPFGVVTAPKSIRFERLLPGPIERVWSYLADSDKRGQWLSAGALPTHPGANFNMRFEHRTLSDDVAPTPERYRHLEGGHVSQHRLLRCDPPRTLIITWSDGADGESQVAFELSPEGDQVRLVLTHTRLANDDVLRSVAKGWHTHLAVLEEKLNGRKPKAFWTLRAAVNDVYDRRISGSDGA